jgi:hypothetical protein
MMAGTYIFWLPKSVLTAVAESRQLRLLFLRIGCLDLCRFKA